jgi:hypothetical protein
MDCAWAIASRARSSLHAGGATPNWPRARLCASSTLWRSNAGPRSAGRGQLALGRVAAGADEAISNAKRQTRFIRAIVPPTG